MRTISIIAIILLLADSPGYRNVPGTIACRKKGVLEMALSHKKPLEGRFLRLKLYCLHSSCKLGPEVPLSQRWIKKCIQLILTLLSFMIWGMNQMPYISSHDKHGIMNTFNTTNGKPKGIRKLINGNAQAPKDLLFKKEKHGAGALQVPLHRKGISGQTVHFLRLRPYCNCSSKGITKLRNINNIRSTNPNFVFKRVYNIVLSEDLFILAYQNLKSKKGVMTPGSDGVTPDGFTSKIIHKLVGELKKETFKFKPARRIYIPKSNGGERPLSIPSFQDKLVQEILRIILEAIYEPSFIPYSHGFRKGKSCHTALKDIRVTFAGVKWLMTRDIEKCFDSFNHHKLVSILQKRISDQRFINLIWKLLRAGYLEDFKVITTSLRGAPQGGVVSPILSNIYLHELDKYIRMLRQEFYKGKYRATNPLYSKWRAKYNYWKTKDTELSNRYYCLSNSVSAKDPYDLNYRRLLYVRYADDFIIGLIGTAKEALEVKDKVNNFLSSSLLLNTSSNKNTFVSASKRRARFLGVEVRIPIYKEPSFSTYKRTRAGKVQLVHAKRSQGVVKLKVNMKNIISKLRSAGFCNKLGEPSPRFQLFAISHKDIILTYNSVFNGLKNYFRFIDNYSSMAFTIQYILITSCAKLLAAKLKLKTTRAVYKKFGKGLNRRSPKFLWSPSYSKSRIRFIVNKHSTDCLYTLYIKKFVNSDLLGPCVRCNSLENIEIHHVKHVKNIKKGLRPLVKDYPIINRKQVPLCKACHLKVHKGLYNGPKLRSIASEG